MNVFISGFLEQLMVCRLKVKVVKPVSYHVYFKFLDSQPFIRFGQVYLTHQGDFTNLLQTTFRNSLKGFYIFGLSALFSQVFLRW